MARFYGWTHEYISNMPHKTALRYWKALKVIKAREELTNMNIALYPKMKVDGRNKRDREIRREAFPTHLQKTMEFEDLEKQLKLKGLV